MSDTSSLVSGRFRLGELLGTGGSASVFAAVDVRTGSSAALKILHPHLSERPAAREAFLAEARRAEPLRHPNIVGVLGVGVDDTGGVPLAWIALERAAGSSLSEHLVRYGPLSPPDAVAVVDGILRALEAAHAFGLIHRDVSPSNVMVAPGPSGVSGVSGAIDRDGVRLLDFGLADVAGKAALGTDELLSVEATGRAGVIGNVDYMSPEQVRGAAVDARGDVYQAGAVLHFALTGRPPFPRDTTGQTMRAHLDTPPPVPSVTDSRIPRALDRIVVRAMLKDPGDRFASAAAMRAALTELGSVAARSGARTPTSPAPATSVTDTAGGSASHHEGAADASRLPVEHLTGPDGVTRVLGRTRVPARIPGAAGSVTTSGHAPSARAPHIRSRAGTWFAAATAAIVAVIVIAAAATSSPTASVESERAAQAPSEAPVSSEQAPPPQPEPEPAEPIVSLSTVPDLSGYTVGEAVRAIADAGLAAGEIRRVDSPLAADTVLESSPAAGHRLGAGGTVTLIVASGLNTIPDVAGQGRDAAASMVQAAGFAPSFAYRTAPAGTPAGTILGTDPRAGTVFAVGTSLTILEALAPTPTPTPTPSRTTPAPTPTPTAEPGE